MRTLKIKKSTWLKRRTASADSQPSEDKVEVSAGDSFNIHQAFRVGNHCFVTFESVIAGFGSHGYFFSDHVEVETEDLRGVWLTNVGSNVLNSKDNIKTAIATLKRHKFNTLYPGVWNGNFTLYPSSVTESVFGHSTHPSFRGRDMMDEFLEVAQDAGMRVIPWFEYGLMTLPNSPLFDVHKDWFTQDSRKEFVRLKLQNDGSHKPDDHIWLNPCKAEVRGFMVDLLQEFIQKYPQVDGIQLDDHFGMPKEMGYDSFTVQQYKNDTGIDDPPKSSADSGWQRWVDWRVKQVTALMEGIVKTVKDVNRNCLICLSPNPQSFSRKEYLADWNLWRQKSWLDELVVQIYRTNVPNFVSEIVKDELSKAKVDIITGVGVFTGYKSDPRSSSLIKKHIAEVKARDYPGYAYFYYDTMLNEKLKPSMVARDDLSFLA